MGEETKRSSLYHARKEHGWTTELAALKLRELANDEGVKLPPGINGLAIQQWEREDVEPDPASVYCLCLLYETSPSGLGMTSRWPWRVDPADAALSISPKQVNGANDASSAKVDNLMAWPSTELWEKLQPVKERALISADSYDYFLSVIEACWRIIDNGDMTAAERVLGCLLPSFLELRDRLPAARVTIYGLQLLGVIRGHQMQLADKLSLYQQATKYAMETGEADLIASSLYRLSFGYRYTGHIKKWMETALTALQYARSASPLEQARAYAVAGWVFACKNQADVAYEHFAQAEELMPAHLETVEHFRLFDFGPQYLIEYETPAQIALGRPEEALYISSGYRSLPEAKTKPMRNILEIANHESLAAILCHDKDHYEKTLITVVTESLAIGSKKRFDEAVTLFREHAPAEWQRDSTLSSAVSSL